MDRSPESGVPSGMKPEPSTKRPLVRLLLYGALAYLIGIVVIAMKMKGIEIEPFWNRVRLPSSFSEEEEKAEKEAGPPKDNKEAGGDGARERTRRFREEPIADNLPELEGVVSAESALSAVPADPIHLADPTGPTPPELLVKEPLSTVKCWDNKGFEHDDGECDLPEDLGKALAERLYILDVCRRETTGPSNTGRLHFSLEADFIRGGLSCWAGEGSTLRFADRIVPCAAERLRGIALSSIAHRYSRYHISAQIDFVIPRRQIAVPVPSGTPSSEAPAEAEQSAAGQPPTGEGETAPVARVDRIEEALKLAKEVSVTRERVRVRKDPVDGEIVGFISKPRKVKLIDKNGDWCRVQTQRGTLGWMVCWALDLTVKNPPQKK